MKKSVSYVPWWLGIALSCLVVCLPRQLYASTVFELLPGGTITLTNGPTESLSGMFILEEGETFEPEPGLFITVFDIDELSLLSRSVELHTSTATNRLRLIRFVAPNTLGQWETRHVAGGLAQTAGLPVPTVDLRGGVAPSGDPTIDRIEFYLGIYDAEDTYRLGTMRFTAVAVPEPTTVEALMELISQSSLSQKQPLLTTLEVALASIQRGNHASALGKLQAFQNMVEAQVSKKNAALAFVLIAGAEEVIDSLRE